MGAKPPCWLRINHLHPMARNLVSFFPLNEGIGNQINDLARRESGLIYNTVLWKPGRSGWALEFPDGEVGNSIFLGIPLNMPTAWTYSIWFYPTSADESHAGICGQINTPRITFHTNRSIYFACSYSDDSWAGGQLTEALDLDTWHHIVVTWQDADTAAPIAKLYHDGILVATRNYAQALKLPNLIHYLNNIDGHARYKGMLDLPMIWSRALSSEEIANLYADPYSIFDEE